MVIDLEKKIEDKVKELERINKEIEKIKEKKGKGGASEGERETEEKLADLVSEDKHAKLLEKAVEADIRRQREGYLDSIGWEAWEIGATGPDMLKLRKLGIVEVVYKSNKHTGYKLVDREKIKEIVK